jgi:4,5-dihydroxyphthalate decarboxylase
MTAQPHNEESGMKIVLGRDDLAAAAVAAATRTGIAAERADVRPVHRASRGFVNHESADVCELAVVTLLQAAAYGKPVALLPVTTLGRYQHQTLVTIGERTVEDLVGGSVGVRSWSQTTGVWVRGFLTESYGVDLAAVHWRTYEDGHVDDHTDPQWVTRAPEGAKLPADFLDGRLDFGVMGNELPADDRIRTAIPDALAVAEKWSVSKGFAPINHVVGFSATAAGENAKAVLAVYDALRDAVATTSPATAPVNLTPVGFDALRAPVTQAATYAYQQGVLPRPVEFDELVEQTCAALGTRPDRLAD